MTRERGEMDEKMSDETRCKVRYKRMSTDSSPIGTCMYGKGNTYRKGNVLISNIHGRGLMAIKFFKGREFLANGLKPRVSLRKGGFQIDLSGSTYASANPDS
jgi:hypothetical protein